MAEIVLGDIVARLRTDSTEFVRGMQAAEQALQRFQQQTAQHAASFLGIPPCPTRAGDARGILG